MIRAYGGTARLVLRAAERTILIPQATVRVRTQSSNAGRIYATATKFGDGEARDERYRDDGDWEVSLVCDASCVEQLREELRDVTRGCVEFLEVDDDDDDDDDDG